MRKKGIRYTSFCDNKSHSIWSLFRSFSSLGARTPFFQWFSHLPEMSISSNNIYSLPDNILSRVTMVLMVLTINFMILDSMIVYDTLVPRLMSRFLYRTITRMRVTKRCTISLFYNKSFLENDNYMVSPRLSVCISNLYLARSSP